MKSNKQPEIRFPGFTEDWEQRKLKGLATFSKGAVYTKNDLVEEGTPIILYGRLYTKYQTVFENIDTFVNMKGKSVLSEGDEVIVPSSGESSEDISRASVVKKSGILLGGDLNIIKTNKDVNSTFLALTISNGKQQKELSKRAQGKSIVHLHNSDLKEVDLIYPTIEEQTKIGNFFKRVDDTITLHQQELTALKETKQSFLQKMFPKEGEKVPEIRFPGFTDDWEQCKFKDLTKISQGLQIAISDRYTEPNDNRLFYITNEFLNPKSNVRYYIEDAPKSVIANNDDILMTRTGNTGKVVTNVHGAFHNNFFKIDYHKSQTNKLFLYYLLNTRHVQNEIRLGAGSSTIPDLKHPNFYRIRVTIPSLLEQIKIGNFFKQLDDTIALHQRELDLLKETKKAFLQKMFV